MRTARELLDALLVALVSEPEVVLPLFADDGVYEAPYLESLGLPWRYRGPDDLRRFLDAHRALFPRLEIHDVVIVADAADRVVAEYQYTTRSARTARTIHQLIVGRLEAADGRITLLRESVDLVELALALYRHGLADFRVPSDRHIWRDP